MILQQLPVEIMEEKFNKNTGRPTKELYSVCGLLLIMNCFGWTMEQALLNYMVDLGVQYALNIETDGVELSERTLYRYMEWLEEGRNGPIFGRFCVFYLKTSGFDAILFKTLFMVDVAQLVGASDCGSECRGFESRHPPHFCKKRNRKSL